MKMKTCHGITIFLPVYHLKKEKFTNKTFDGKFVKFISNIFPNSRIITLDLEDNNFFKNTYKDKKNYLNQFLKLKKIFPLVILNS